jgi:phosphate transport system substrate-binding protein
MIFRQIVFVLGIAGLLLAQSSCSRNVPEGVMELKGAGATFPAPLYSHWFQSYEQSAKGVLISYRGVGSGEGIRRFLAGEDVEPEERVDFGASESPLSEDQIARVERGVQAVPMNAGAIVLAYNLAGLNEELRLSRKVYCGIFLATITKWNDPQIAADNPGVELPDLPITVVARQDSSGTTFAFTNHLTQISPQWSQQFGASKRVGWPGHPMLAPGNEGVAGRIRLSVGAIGYVQRGFAERAKLPTARLENKAGQFVRPTTENAMATLAEADLTHNVWATFPDPSGKHSYPIVTLTWILLYRDYERAEKANALRQLFRWCLEEGRHHSEQLGYVPLPPQLVSHSIALLDNLGP